MDYPHHALYARLYARYLRPERVAQLIELAGSLNDRRVLDLCGGGGRLSAAAAEAGARVITVDESLPMMDDERVPLAPSTASPRHLMDTLTTGQVVAVRARLPEGFADLPVVDVAFCQQAVNYWMTPSAAEALAACLRPNGLFLFNTFGHPPPTTPTVKAYTYQGLHYVEVLQRVRDPADSLTDWVEHVQMCEGLSPHVTRFRWIPAVLFRAWLSPWFDLEEIVEGPTSLWRCRRR